MCITLIMLAQYIVLTIDVMNNRSHFIAQYKSIDYLTSQTVRPLLLYFFWWVVRASTDDASVVNEWRVQCVWLQDRQWMIWRHRYFQILSCCRHSTVVECFNKHSRVRNGSALPDELQRLWVLQHRSTISRKTSETTSETEKDFQLPNTSLIFQSNQGMVCTGSSQLAPSIQ